METDSLRSLLTALSLGQHALHKAQLVVRVLLLSQEILILLVQDVLLLLLLLTAKLRHLTKVGVVLVLGVGKR